MSSIKRLFERHSDSVGGIASHEEWKAFESDLIGFGLGSPAFTKVLSTVWSNSIAAGRPVAYLDLIAQAAAYSPDDEASKIVADLRQDATALRRFVDYVRARYKKDSKERKSLESGECQLSTDMAARPKWRGWLAGRRSKLDNC